MQLRPARTAHIPSTSPLAREVCKESLVPALASIDDGTMHHAARGADSTKPLLKFLCLVQLTLRHAKCLSQPIRRCLSLAKRQSPTNAKLLSLVRRRRCKRRGVYHAPQAIRKHQQRPTPLLIRPPLGAHRSICQGVRRRRPRHRRPAHNSVVGVPCATSISERRRLVFREGKACRRGAPRPSTCNCPVHLPLTPAGALPIVCLYSGGVSL